MGVAFPERRSWVRPADKPAIFSGDPAPGTWPSLAHCIFRRMFNPASGQTILNNYRGKWFNLKVAFNTQTLQVRTYVNNCLKATSRSPRGPTPDWYFKHGVYTCDSGTCRSHYKNIHLYHRGGTPPPPAIQR